MKTYAVLLCLVFLLWSPVGLNAAEDLYDTAKIRTADPDALINTGVTVMSFPEKVKSGSDAADKEQEAKKQQLDKKVDDAIKKAWGDQ